MKILVTGGTGFIGSHTVVELQNRGFEVIIADNLSNSFEFVVDNIEKITGVRPVFVNIDLSDRKDVEAFFNQYAIDAIIHFAASKAVGESVSLPIQYYRNNLNSLMNIIEAMEKHVIKHLVFSSSCTVYGQPDELPVKEGSPIKPALSPYGNTKQICEEIITDFIHANKGFQSILLRYFNPIGAHDSGIIGELPIGIPNNLIPFITQTAAGIRKSLNVFGGDYNTPDGTAIRDYIHVVDLAKAHTAALDRMIGTKSKKDVEIFNIGTGNGYSVLEAIKSFEKVSGMKLNYQIVARREGDIEKVWADTSFANIELGWNAKKGIDEMMSSAWKWQNSTHCGAANNIK